MIRYRASWVLPISRSPLRHGWVTVDRDRVVALGDGAAMDGSAELNLGSVAILPGLVNAHTHLELSSLSRRVPPAEEFVGWIRGVVALRRMTPDPAGPDLLAAIAGGIAESLRCGTALVGDISNTLATVGPLTQSDLAAVVFYELIRFNTSDPEGVVEDACRRLDALGETAHVRTALAAHAPYSVAPLVFRAIRRAADRRSCTLRSVHVSESRDETAFMRDGSGAWRGFLDQVGAWDPGWVAPGVSPVQFLDENDFLNDRVLAVHGVQMTSSDLARLASAGATLVACPRSNAYTGAGVPPIAEFYASGVRVAVGTDSLASAPDLSVFAELAVLRALAPGVTASTLLDSATRQGARALGFEADYGTIEPGRRARLLAVSVPDGIDDVEEYLVSGVQPDQVRWLDA